jgi:hypothetical protein
MKQLACGNAEGMAQEHLEEMSKQVIDPGHTTDDNGYRGESSQNINSRKVRAEQNK